MPKSKKPSRSQPGSNAPNTGRRNIKPREPRILPQEDDEAMRSEEWHSIQTDEAVAKYYASLDNNEETILPAANFASCTTSGLG